MPTVSAGATGIPNAFGIAAGAINRAYVGFDADCARDSNTAEAFWGQMASGETVQTARDRAQIEYNRIAGLYPAHLVIVGDPLATLHSLYPTKAQTPWWRLH